MGLVQYSEELRAMKLEVEQLRPVGAAMNIVYAATCEDMQQAWAVSLQVLCCRHAVNGLAAAYCPPAYLSLAQLAP